MNFSATESANLQRRLLDLQQRAPRFWTAEERRIAFAFLKAELEHREIAQDRDYSE